jgi:hypothetical protein
MKYYGLAGLSALVLTGIVGWQVLAPGKSITVVAPVEQASAGTAELDRDLARTQQLSASLDAIAARAFEPRPGTPVIAFVRGAPLDKSAMANVLGPDGQPLEEEPQYKREVTLLYSGRGFNRAVVDGKYVRRGARLPDGSKVLNITRDTVVIKTPEGRQTLRVQNPRTAPKPVAKGNMK